MQEWTQVSRGIAHQWQCDHYGHMNARFYAHIFDDAGFVLWDQVGAGRGAMQQEGVHTVIARTETDLVKELVAGQTYEVEARWVAMGEKSVTVELRLLDLANGDLHARQRVVEVFFDPRTRGSTRIPESIREVVQPRLAES